MAVNHSLPPEIYEWEDELQLKLQFAKITAGRPEMYFSAGYEVFTGPENYGRAMACVAWLHDPIVRREWERRLGAQTEDVDDKEQSVRERLAIARDPNVPIEARLKAYDQIDDVNGWKTSKTGNTNNTVVLINPILRVPTRDVTPEDDEDFNVRFKANQMKLVNNAKSSRPN